MPNTVTYRGICSLVLFSIALVGCPSPKRNALPQAGTEVTVPNPFERSKEKRKSREGLNSQQLATLNSADGNALETKQQCAVDICGPLGRQISAHDIFNGRIPDSQQGMLMLNSHVLPLLDRALALRVESERKTLERVETQAAALVNVQLPSTHVRLANIYWALSRTNEALKAVDPMLHLVDEVKLARVFSELSSQDISFLARFVNVFIVTGLVRDLRLLNQFKLQEFLEVLNVRSMTSFAQEIKTKADRLHSMFPAVHLRRSPAVDRLANGEDVDSEELLSIDADIVLGYVYDYVTTVEVFSQRNPQLQSLLRDFIANLPAEKEKNSNSTRLHDARSAALHECRIATNQIAAINMTDQDIQNSRRLLEQAKQVALAEGKKLADSNDAKGRIETLMQSLDFLMPPTALQHLARITRSLSSDINGEQARINNFSQISNEDLALNVYIDSAFENDFFNLSDLCETHQASNINDFNLSGRGKINVSWQTIKFPETGAGVIAHEIGHAIFDTLRGSGNTTKSAEVLRCTQARHGNQPTRVDSAIEDFADVFSTRVMSQLQVPKKNMACVLLGDDGTNYGSLQGLSLRWPRGSNDNHSPSFYRLIQNEIDSGRPLSANCSSVVAASLPSMRRVCSR